MKDSIVKQLTSVKTKYGWIGSMAIKNMRLLLLLLFAGLSAYLVLRINSLVSEEVVTPKDDTSAVAKKVDTDVLSAFNELSVQQVQLDSNFVQNRENPF